MGIEAKVKRGPIGLFDVYVDEWVVYSNRREGGRLPRNDDIIARIKDYQTRPSLPAKGVQSKSGNKGAGADQPQSNDTQCGCG